MSSSDPKIVVPVSLAVLAAVIALSTAVGDLPNPGDGTVEVGAAATPYSIDHQRVQANAPEPGEPPATF